MKEPKQSILTIIIGLMPLFIGLYLTFFIATDCEFNCTRTSDNQGTCQYIEKRLFSKQISDLSLFNINNSETKKDCVRDECSLGVVINLKEGQSINITGGNSSSNTNMNKMYVYNSDINSFIKDHEKKSLKTEYTGAFTFYVFGIIFAIAGIIISSIGVFKLFKQVQA